MRVVFFEPFAIYSPHFETCLEIMQCHISDGYSVTFIGCDATLPACEPNPKHDLAICLRCISRRNQGLQRLEGGEDIEYLSLTDLSSPPAGDITLTEWKFSDINELKKYKIKDNDIGMAVASTLISLYRTPTPDFASCRDVLINFLSAAYGTYYAFNCYLDNNKLDKLYLFNGRFSFLRSVLRSCQEHGVDCFVHERGCNFHKYSICCNTLPHDIKSFEKRLLESWNKVGDEERRSGAERFYHERAEGKDQSWFSFTAGQTKGLLPDNWQSDKLNLVIFNSSEDELAAIGSEWENPIYKDQFHGIKKIVSDLSERKEVHLYLRVHPNLKNVNNKSVTSLFEISSDNFTLIPADSKVCTYSLIRSADKIITFGSTVGIEAAFWGTVSILAGMSYYRNLGSVYLPRNHNELIEMALDDLSPKDTTGAFMYGYYFNSFGVDFKYFEPNGFGSGLFKGKKIKPSFMITALFLISRLPFLKSGFSKLVEVMQKSIIRIMINYSL
ncbi:MAG TPA: hypothetical protein DCX54_06940 [Flavobacteriales bacterium]|nr:hypothetical protein [Flavobacteriales bacterium]